MEEIIVEVRAEEGGGNIKATADITFLTELGELTILRAKVIQQTAAHLWVAFPQASYEKDGKKNYVSVLQFSRRLKKHIEEKVIEAYKKISLAA